MDTKDGHNGYRGFFPAPPNMLRQHQIRHLHTIVIPEGMITMADTTITVATIITAVGITMVVVMAGIMAGISDSRRRMHENIILFSFL